MLTRLTGAGRIVARDRLALTGRTVTLDARDGLVLAAIERAFRDAGLAPPELAGVAVGAGADPESAARLAQLLVRRRTLVSIAGMLFHAGALEALKADLRELKGTSPGVDVGSFKERYGVSRKYAIPLLEYLDRERVTRRSGSLRIIL